MQSGPPPDFLGGSLARHVAFGLVAGLQAASVRVRPLSTRSHILLRVSAVPCHGHGAAPANWSAAGPRDGPVVRGEMAGSGFGARRLGGLLHHRQTVRPSGVSCCWER